MPVSHDSCSYIAFWNATYVNLSISTVMSALKVNTSWLYGAVFHNKHSVPFALTYRLTLSHHYLIAWWMILCWIADHGRFSQSMPKLITAVTDKRVSTVSIIYGMTAINYWHCAGNCGSYTAADKHFERLLRCIAVWCELVMAFKACITAIMNRLTYVAFHECNTKTSTRIAGNVCCCYVVNLFRYLPAEDCENTM